MQNSDRIRLSVSHSPNGLGVGGVQAVIRNIQKYSKTFKPVNPLNADIFHSHALDIQQRTDVFTCHGMYIHEEYDKKFSDSINNKIQKSIDRATIATIVAKWAQKIITDMTGCSFYHIPNGYNIDDIHEEIQAGLFKLGPKFKFNRPTFILAPGWSIVKNPYEIVEFAKKVPEVDFVIASDRRDIVGESSNVKIIGNQPHDKLMAMMYLSTGVISPFELENCPGIVLESFAMRKPVIGCAPGPESIYYNLGGNYELIDDKTGEIYYHKDPDSFRRAIMTCFTKDYDFSQKDIIYDWNRICAQYDQLYQGITELPVSCIVLAYNEHKYLPRALASIPPSVEVIVADASHNHKKIVPPYCKYIQVPNKNLSDNRTKAIQACTRKYVTMLDADDVALDGKFSLFKYLEENSSLGGVFGDASVEGKSYTNVLVKGLVDKKVYHLQDFLRSNLASSGSVMFRRDLFTSGKMDFGKGKYRYGEDYRAWISVAAHGGMKYIDQTIYYYDTSKNTITRKAPIEDAKRMLEDSMREYGVEEVENVSFGVLKRTPD
ncbi:MAG: glycosyltransferase [Clostridia bacterium]